MSHADDRVAELAHELWCEAMVAAGWRHGPRFDPRSKAHDAMVPYARLTPADRRQLLIAVRAEGAAAALMRLVSHRRGPDRPLTLEEVKPGLAVSSSRIAGHGDATAADIGRIESWETDDRQEFLTLVRVRWPDGALTEHIPEACELRRASEE